jgi:hypothetical protein
LGERAIPWVIVCERRLYVMAAALEEKTLEIQCV